MVEVGINDILRDKKNVKSAFALRLGIAKNIPMVVVLADKKKDEAVADIVCDLVSAWGEIDATLVVVANDSSLWSEGMNIARVDYEDKIVAELLVAGDIVVDFTDMSADKMLFSRIVPVAEVKKGLEDYSPVKETGNAFLYKTRSALAVFGALNRAIETAKLKYDWKQIVKGLV